jgi:hypothetical protein
MTGTDYPSLKEGFDGGFKSLGVAWGRTAEFGFNRRRIASVNTVRSHVVGAKVRFVSSKDVVVKEYERGNTLLRNGGGQLFHSPAVEIGGCVYVAGVTVGTGVVGSGTGGQNPKERVRIRGILGRRCWWSTTRTPQRVGLMAVLGSLEVRLGVKNS